MYRAGFYNNKVVNGVNDREYTAEDLMKPYDTVFTDGILPEPDGTAGNVLKVSAMGSMTVAISAGHAKLGGYWFENDSSFILALSDGGSSDRYDCIIIRNDSSEAVREPSIYVKSLSSPPTASDLTRNATIYEICVAYVKVKALSDSITDSDIVDTREDGTLCNIMSGVGATVVRVFRNTYFSESAGQSVIPIGIPQYNSARDNLTVIVEGRIMAEGSNANYTINDNTTITLNIGLPVVGTRVDFEVSKNVNAAGAETVVQEVAELMDDVAAIKKTLEHHYYCNGTNDNQKISAIAQAYLQGGNRYDSMKLVVHGTPGITEPFSGNGTSSRHYFWFALGLDGQSTNRKLIVDFSDCREISIPVEAGTYNSVFAGKDVHIIGANVLANQNGTGTVIRMFNSSGGVVTADDCRFWITADNASYISRTGTFTRCRGSVTTYGGSSNCFLAGSNSILRIHGGEYYAYSPTTNNATTAVLYQTDSTAVVIMYGVNCPTVGRSGFVQNSAVNAIGSKVSITDTITTLPLNVPAGNVRGTLAANMTGMM